MQGDLLSDSIMWLSYVNKKSFCTHDKSKEVYHNAISAYQKDFVVSAAKEVPNLAKAMQNLAIEENPLEAKSPEERPALLYIVKAVEYATY